MHKISRYKITLLMAMLLFLFGVASAQYYADATFEVDETGKVIISGISNIPSLSKGATHDLTSKRGLYWIFNYSSEFDVSDFTYTVRLPPGSEINYVRSPPSFRIGNEDGMTFVKGTGKDKKISILIQYSLQPGIVQYNSLIITMLAVAAIASAAVLFYHLRKRKSLTNPMHESSPKLTWYDKNLLSERQLAIVEILERESKPLTQREIELKTGIPKSSMSRNIESLVRRGIITKQPKGMTNTIMLNTTRPEL